MSDTCHKSLLFVNPSNTFARQLVSAICLKSDLISLGGRTLGTGVIIDCFKGARSCYFRQFCLILLIMSSKRQTGRPRVFHLQNHGHITTENDFPAE